MSSDEYISMIEIPYESNMVVAISDSDNYLFTEQDIKDYMNERRIDAKDLNLVICEPNRVYEIDPDDYYADELSEDGSLEDIDPELYAMFEKLNEMIRERRTILSWSPGRKRTRYVP